ncbi:MAG: hypothetical protein IPK33_03020 [Gemmatimonadetes bacterium]|nr:hypothetical protein [Gemmatimonadota bacterium]
MIQLRPAQVAHLADHTRRRFVDRMHEYIRSTFAPRVAHLDQTALRAWVQNAVARCEQFAVDTEPEAAQLILLLLVLGLDVLERHPWSRDVLTARDLIPLGKVRLLVRTARKHAVNDIEAVLVFDEMAERDVIVPEG